MARSENCLGAMLIVQAWLIPCHGFASVPHFGRARWLPHAVPASRTARAFSLASAAHSTRGATAMLKARSRDPASCPRLRMSDGRDPRGDESAGAISGASEGPGPYRDEHDSGASRFRDLLARAKKVDPAVEERLGLRPKPYTPTPQENAQPQPRRPLPPRPDNPPNYDNLDEWDRIGSPDLPDRPLRNEMPGLQIPREMSNGDALGTDTEAGDGSSSEGSRFRNLMSQARNNSEREKTGGLPRTSGRPAGGGAQAPRETFTKEEKARAVRAAVERQQKLMAKAKGIDLDDPSLDGPALQRMRAISRAQAEATGGGYVPSSSASDDYFDQLKRDSKRKIKRLQAKLEGVAIPEEEDQISTMPTAEEVRDDRAPEFAPQRKTKASLSIQNESDAYIAALSGIKVDIKKNPYLKGQSTTDFIETDDDSPAAITRKVFRPPTLPPPSPTGPTISYAERLKKAREAKESEASGGSPSSDAAVQPAVPAQAQPPATPHAAAAVSYAERLKQAQAAKAPTGGSDVVKIAARPQPSPSAPRQFPIENRADAVAPQQTRLLDQQLAGDPLADHDGPETKMMHVMDLLTEHKTTGLRSEARVMELRNALVDAREALRLETYGGSPPSPITLAAATAPVTAPREPVVALPAAPSAQPAGAAPALPQSTQQAAAVSGTDKETLRRCSALLAAHVHSSLSGNDIMALREALIASLTILENQIDNGALFEDTWSVSGDSAAPPHEDGQSPGGMEGDDEPVPVSLGGIQSVGAVLSDMGVGKKPAKFEPETDSPPTAAALKGAPPADGQGKRWTDGSLGVYEKGVATKGLGYLLKHRGGKGYGRGRVKGLEAENMVATLAELTEILHDEMVEG